jgi:hypothetical protein
MRTETLHDEQGRVSHPGGDAWAFAYGTRTIPEGRENCAPPIGIGIDPCALTIDSRIIPKASRPARSMVVRGAQADVNEYGITFEQSPHIISIGAPPQVYLGQGLEAYAAERAANAVTIAEALIPANAPAAAAASAAASALAPDALITAALGAMDTVACP